MRRKNKEIFRNEKEVMEDLGMKQRKGSGNTWIEKEDGANDYLISQLKTTDASSMRILLKDIRELEYHAATEHKIPIFINQFRGKGDDDLWIMMRPEDITSVAQYLKTGECKISDPIISGFDLGKDDGEVESHFMYDKDGVLLSESHKKVKSSKKSRDEIKKQNAKKYDKTKKATSGLFDD